MVEVLIPFHGDCPYRLKALEFTRRQYPWPVVVCSYDGPWSKGAALRPGIEASSADILVVADADCSTSGLPSAIEAVEDGAAWAMPHRRVVRLTEQGTEIFKATGEYGHPFDRRPYTGMPGGGMVVARRETLLEVGPDPRFVGWGQEDESWALALTCLVGKPWRGTADLIHLYHPPEPRMSRRKGSPESWALYRRYRDAARDPLAMRSLLKEASRGIQLP